MIEKMAAQARALATQVHTSENELKKAEGEAAKHAKKEKAQKEKRMLNCEIPWRRQESES